jgi:tetratricopeptide (TPR) repeat protein
VSEGAAAAPTPRDTLRAALALLGLGLLLYGPALRYGFIYDDLLHVVEEPVPESLRQLARIFAEPMSPLVPYYRPLARLLNAAQLALHGPAPAPFHLVNFALGIACAWALRALFLTPAIGASARVATFAALLFLAHPLASECVVPVASGRETLLPTLFTLLALGAYFRGAARGRALALACFALGLLSKEQAIATPLLLALADVLGLAPGAPRGARAWAARYAPYALVVAAYALARGAAVPDALTPGIALFQRPEGPLLSLLYDVQTTFAPFARLIYEPRLAVWWSWPRLALAGVAASALVLAAARSDLRRTVWLLALIVLSLAPTANVLVQEPGFAERWGFAALAGWAGLLALATPTASAALRGRALRTSAAAAAISALALATAARSGAYRDNEAFLAQWLRSDPTSAQAWISSGEAHERRGELAEAIAAYRHVLSLDPDVALAHASLAIALAQRGQLAEAQAHAQRAVALDPNDAESWSNLGGIQAQRGDVAGAVAHYQRALALRPELASAHNNLALALRARGDLVGARSQLEAALAARPGFAEAHANLGDLLAAQGDLAGAEAHLARALELDPALVPARAALARLRAR